MRFIEQASAAALLTVSLAGCTSAPTPEQVPSISASPESTRTPDQPTPSVEALPTPVFSEACSDELALNAISTDLEPALGPLTASLEELLPEQLVELQQDNLDTLAKASLRADKISARFGDTSSMGAIEIPNYAQPKQDFSRTPNLEQSQVIMEDWLFGDNGQYCKISSATTELGADASRNYLELKLGTQVFRFLRADGTVKMADGTPLTAEAVSVSTVISERYFRIVDDALNNPKTFEFAPENTTHSDLIDT